MPSRRLLAAPRPRTAISTDLCRVWNLISKLAGAGLCDECRETSAHRATGEVGGATFRFVAGEARGKPIFKDAGAHDVPPSADRRAGGRLVRSGGRAASPGATRASAIQGPSNATGARVAVERRTASVSASSWLAFELPLEKLIMKEALTEKYCALPAIGRASTRCAR